MSKKIYKIGISNDVSETTDFGIDGTNHLSGEQYVKDLFSTKNKDLNAANILMSDSETETISSAIDKKFDKTGGEIDGDLSVKGGIKFSKWARITFLSGSYIIEGADSNIRFYNIIKNTYSDIPFLFTTMNTKARKVYSSQLFADGSNVVTLSVGDTRYLLSGATAEDSKKLNGQLSEYYATSAAVDSLSDIYQKQSEMTAYATSADVNQKRDKTDLSVYSDWDFSKFVEAMPTFDPKAFYVGAIQNDEWYRAVIPVGKSGFSNAILVDIQHEFETSAAALASSEQFIASAQTEGPYWALNGITIYKNQWKNGDTLAKVSDINGLSTVISEALSSKIKVGTAEYAEGATSATYTLQPSDLSVVKINNDDYYRLVADAKLDPNTIYILSSVQLNAYGKRITNVASPLSALDAVNLSSMNIAIDGLSDIYQKQSGMSAYATSAAVDGLSDIYQKQSGMTVYATTATTNSLSTSIDGLSDIYQKQSEMTAYASVDSVSSKIVVGTCTYAEGATSATYALQPNNLSVVKMTNDDYYRLVADDKYDANMLYVLSSNQLNAHGEQIIDVAAPLSATDAVNLSSMNMAIPAGIATKTASALAVAPEIATILSADDATFIQNLDHDSIVSVLLAFKKVFASLSAN